MNQQLKALISTRAKKIIPSQLFAYFKGKQQFTGCFHPWQPFVYRGSTGSCKKVAKGDKANHGWENTL